MADAEQFGVEFRQCASAIYFALYRSQSVMRDRTLHSYERLGTRLPVGNFDRTPLDIKSVRQRLNRYDGFVLRDDDSRPGYAVHGHNTLRIQRRQSLTQRHVETVLGKLHKAGLAPDRRVACFTPLLLPC